MATTNGADAVGMGDELGRLEPGFLADLTIVDTRTANMAPVHDPHAALVTSMKSENVRSVLCEGEWLMRDGRVLALDEDALLAEAAERAVAIRGRLAR